MQKFEEHLFDGIVLLSILGFIYQTVQVYDLQAKLDKYQQNESKQYLLLEDPKIRAIMCVKGQKGT